MTDPQRPGADDDPAMCRHGTRESEGWCAQCEVLGHDPKVTSADDERLAELHRRIKRWQHCIKAGYSGAGRGFDEYAASDVEMLLLRLDERTRERDEARAALGFAASVIKSGEEWTETCEREIGGVLRGPPSADKLGEP